MFSLPIQLMTSSVYNLKNHNKKKVIFTCKGALRIYCRFKWGIPSDVYFNSQVAMELKIYSKTCCASFAISVFQDARFAVNKISLLYFLKGIFLIKKLPCNIPLSGFLSVTLAHENGKIIFPRVPLVPSSESNHVHRLSAREEGI